MTAKEKILQVYRQRRHKEIMNFINHFSSFGPDVIDCFTKGNCYWFAAILHERFSESAIAYAPIDNHFGCCIDSIIYDITGDVTNLYKWQPFATYEHFDPLEYERILRDCVYFKENI